MSFSLGIPVLCAHDASDAAQLAELKTLGLSRAWEHDVQWWKDPDVPMDQIEFNVRKQMEECSEAPFYARTTGNRHLPQATITSAIGRRMAQQCCCDA